MEEESVQLQSHHWQKIVIILLIFLGVIVITLLIFYKPAKLTEDLRQIMEKNNITSEELSGELASGSSLQKNDNNSTVNTNLDNVAKKYLKTLKECERATNKDDVIYCLGTQAVVDGDDSICTFIEEESSRYACRIMIRQQIAIYRNDSQECEKLDNKYLDRDECYYYFAIERNQPDICAKIIDREHAVSINECYYRLAIRTNHEELCEKIDLASKKQSCHYDFSRYYTEAAVEERNIMKYTEEAIKAKDVMKCNLIKGKDDRRTCYGRVAVDNENETLCDEISGTNSERDDRESCHYFMSLYKRALEQQQIQQAGTQVGKATACADVEFQLLSCKPNAATLTNLDAAVKVSQGTVSEVQFIVDQLDGTTKVYGDQTGEIIGVVPTMLSTNVLTIINGQDGATTPAKISAIPVVTTDDGTKATCAETLKVTCS